MNAYKQNIVDVITTHHPGLYVLLFDILDWNRYELPYAPRDYWAAMAAIAQILQKETPLHPRVVRLQFAFVKDDTSANFGIYDIEVEGLSLREVHALTREQIAIQHPNTAFAVGWTKSDTSFTDSEFRHQAGLQVLHSVWSTFDTLLESRTDEPIRYTQAELDLAIQDAKTEERLRIAREALEFDPDNSGFREFADILRDGGDQK